MADVTISSLPLGTPSGNALLPYSTGSNTLGVPVSALFHNAGNIGIGTTSPSYLLDLRQNNNGALVNIEGSSDNIAIRLKNNQTGGREYRIISTAQGSGYGTGALALEDQASGSARMVINNAGNVGIGTTSPSSFLDVRGLMGTVYTSPTTVPSGTTATVLDPAGDRFAPYYGHFNEWMRSTFNGLSNYSFIAQATCNWDVNGATDSAVFLILYNHGIRSCEIKRIDNGYMRYNGDTFVSGGGAGPYQRPVIKLTHAGIGSVAPKFVVQLLGTNL